MRDVIRCRILLFAQLADIVGSRAVDLELPDGAVVADALEALEREHAGVGAFRGRVATALDEAYVGAGAVLRDGCTVALIPPVSGG